MTSSLRAAEREGGRPAQTAVSPLDLGRPPYQTPRVYVVVVNWRGATDTMECLESVFRMGYPNLRVVVCDNDSGDGSLQRIRDWASGTLVVETPDPANPAADGFAPVSKPIAVACYDRAEAERGGSGADGDPHLVLIQTGANLGFAGGNNVALRYAVARGDAAYFWLLNNDTVAAPAALSALVDLAEGRDRVGMVGSKLLYYEQPTVIQAIAGGRIDAWKGMASILGEGQSDEGQWSSPVEVDCIVGASLLIRASVVDAVGYMDEQYFMYSEEMDWCVSTHRKGWQLIYAPGSTVWHKSGRSAGVKSPLQDYYVLRSTLLFARKHYPGLLPLTLLYTLFQCALPKVVRREPARLRAVLRAYRDFFQNNEPSHILRTLLP